MPTFNRRLSCAVITATMLFPVAGMAQQEQPGPNQPQVQQPYRHHKGRGKHHRRGMGKMAQRLNLNDQQKQQFQQIRQQSKQQALAIRNDNSLTDADKKQKLQALHKQNREQMVGVLTPEQKEQLKQMREERRKNRSERNPA